MDESLKIAILCFQTTKNPEDNLASVESLLRKAVEQNVKWVFLPELWTHRATEEDQFQKASAWVAEHMLIRMQELAKKYALTIFAGTWTEKSDHPTKYYNTQFVIDPTGRCIAKYRKVHLFSIQNQNKQGYSETKRYIPGEITPPFEVDQWKIGMSTCFDLRFSGFYEKLCECFSVDILTVPSGFLERTGKLHWEALLKARAIEHQCFVIAANQMGPHENPVIGRFYGHSMVINPWGEIILDSGQETGVFTASIDHTKIIEVRNTIPMAEIKSCKKTAY